MRARSLRSVPWPALAMLVGCSLSPSTTRLQEAAHEADQVAGRPRSALVDSEHRGPAVTAGKEGTGRFVAPLYDAFRPERAMETVVFADRFYREPGSEGYRATLEHVRGQLESMDFGKDARLVLEVLEHDPDADLATWTPRRARLALRAPGADAQVLHAFEREEERDRVMLPRNAPSASVSGRVAFDLADLAAGDVLVTRAPLRRDLVNRAVLKGAVAVISSSLEDYNVDPTGRERHLDAVQYRVLLFLPALPVAQISPRSYERLKQADETHSEVHVDFEAVVEVVERPVQTLVATIVGAQRPGEAVAIVSHVQEPGACDNATGVAGLLEGTRALVERLREGKLDWPSRSLVMIWGDEKVQSEVWLESTERKVIAALSSDMTGQSFAQTGAIALLERAPDPGAVKPLPPDEHTPWGATPVEAASLVPNGLSVVARCAMTDVDAHVGGWRTAEHPWEGGSDHDVFIEHGVPAVLFWHFTDFAYHTSLDRIEHVDPEEMRRTAVAILTTALAMADPRPTDLERYLECVSVERELRLAACSDSEDDELGVLWQEWCTGSRMWLRSHCLGLAADERDSTR